jgi:hypothetical protein
MMDLKFKTVTGIEMNLNPFCIGAWYAADGGQTAIQVNGVVHIFAIGIKEADRRIREALAPE